MSVSVFIAKILAVVYLSASLGLIFSPNHYQKVMKGFLKDPAMSYIAGSMALIVGFLIVSLHNVWVKDWQVIITILGWAALLKGIGFLVFPVQQAKLVKKFTKSRDQIVIGGFFALILGSVLGYFGFLANL